MATRGRCIPRGATATSQQGRAAPVTADTQERLFDLGLEVGVFFFLFLINKLY